VIEASRKVGLEVNTEKTKCKVLSCHHTEGQNYSLQIANKSFENMGKFTCLVTTVKNHSFIHEEIKGRLNSGNAY
jgi:hypothetical protein